MKMPVLFIGHGSPMNAVADNDYTRALQRLRRRIARPRAILCISAHWMTKGVWITHQANPRTIHDFGGFPKPLFDVQYPAPGAPALAEDIAARFPALGIVPDDAQWGFDHGAWSVLRHLFPEADVPLLQLSLDLERSGEFHYAAGRALSALRDDGVLIIGSGNVVHNLRLLKWDAAAAAYPWAVAFDAWVAEMLAERNDVALTNDAEKSEAGKLSIPTVEH